eukprot:g1861.t1
MGVDMALLLRLQQFLELARQENPQAGLAFLRGIIVPMVEAKEEYLPIIEDAMEILTFGKSEVGKYMMSVEWRAFVAEATHASLMKAHGVVVRPELLRMVASSASNPKNDRHETPASDLESRPDVLRSSACRLLARVFEQACKLDNE